MVIELNLVWQALALSAPIIFGYPKGGPDWCMKCGKDFPGTDMFWGPHSPTWYCEDCLKNLTEQERAAYETRKSAYDTLLQKIVQLGTGVQVPLDKVEQAAAGSFVKAVLDRKRDARG